MDMFGVGLIVAVLAFLGVKEIKKQSLKNRLLRHVSWCMTERLENEIFFKSVLDLVDEPYRLNQCDKDVVSTVLDTYKENLSIMFFKDELNASKHIVDVTDREYFFLTLNWFLEKHQCDWDFNGNQMHNQIDIKYYDGDGSKATCSFTQFGLTYTKLLHLVATYCISCSSINSNHASFDSIEYLKREIDSNTITISRYRP